MHTLSFLNSHELREINAALEKQWGTELSKDYAYVLRKDGDLFMVNRDVDRVDLAKLNINSLGLYIGEFRGGEFRPGIEGSQLFGPLAKRNVVSISKEQLAKWLAGEELDIDADASGYILLKHENDFVGCGRLVEGKLSNFVPKVRRVRIMQN
jgi:NOL1/NOP2/fmu family ribosome biogenesis protein